MAHHDELLELAHTLLGINSQASLRRAVSTAYYALFHLLIHEAVQRLTGPETTFLRAALTRTFEHDRMKSAVQRYAGDDMPQPPGYGFSNRGGGDADRRGGDAIGAAKKKPRRANPSGLKEIATLFVELQQARHQADYDLSEELSATESRDLVNRVDQVFTQWPAVRQMPEVQEFLLALAFSGKR